ncbi:hypothetical protein E0K90_26475 [Escherichia coli]|nr:hypothetical protein E0K90_26475 [Escherichia coli]
MTSPSSTAGKPCVECGIPDPCIFDVISDFPEAGEKHFWSKEGVARFKEGANKRGNSSRLTQSFHFFMFEPIFSPVNALNQPI